MAAKNPPPDRGPLDRRAAVAQAIHRLAPRLPVFETGVVIDRALASPGLRKGAPETAARLALIAYARHVFTEYDDLLAEGYDRDSARHFILDDLNEALTGWGAQPVPEDAGDEAEEDPEADGSEGD
jgi:hypothetical protein